MSENGPVVLVVDDEPNIRTLLCGVLQDEGYRCRTARDLREAERELRAGPVDLLLLDVCLPGADGLALLRQPPEGLRLPPVIMMSGHGNIQTALEAVRLGADDFLEKPIGGERLLLSVANCLDRGRLRTENERLREATIGSGEILGASEPMRRLREEIARAAPTDARVLITGENGTGKELVARALHAGSSRRERPLVKVNCAAIPAELLESELFGHERGAFTGAIRRRKGRFELAQGGTLLLDEIGDLDPSTQAKLLRVLEEESLERVGGETSIRLDVRVLASTNRDLETLLETGGFRRDLYYRLRVIPIHVPPLREHSQDVAPLAEHFLAQACEQNGRPPRALDPEALRLLRAHPWPGNVRELRHLMERLVIMGERERVGAEEMRSLLGGRIPAEGVALPAGGLAEALVEHERRLISRAVEEAGGNLAEAARRLQVDRGNLHRRLKRLGLRG